MGCVESVASAILDGDEDGDGGEDVAVDTGDDHKTERAKAEAQARAEREKFPMTKQRRAFINKTKSMLSVVLPEIKRIVSSARDEESMHLQIIHVLDQVIGHHNDDLTEEQRRGMLMKSIPKTEEHFKSLVLQANDDESKRKRKRLTGDVDLMRIIKLWFEADRDDSGELEFEEVRALLETLNIEITTHDLRELIRQVDSSGDGAIQFDEFYTMYQRLTTIVPVTTVFNQANSRPGKTEGISYYDAVRFLRQEQRMRFSAEEAPIVVTSFFGAMRNVDGVVGVYKRQFQIALTDIHRNSWLNPKEQHIYHDMSQPLTHYFINSSHNTYLSGHQLTGKSDIRAYTTALRAGCRCVEIDCWDGPNGDPIVYHGHTLTTKLRFYDVIAAIDRAAFEKSPYPIILSLEVHTSLGQQDKMVQIMHEIFGTKLLRAADAEHSTITSPSFTPIGLVRRVIIKAKKSVTQPDGQEAAGGGEGQEAGGGVSASLSDLCWLQAKKFHAPQAARRLPHYSIMSIDEKKMESWEREVNVYGEINKSMFTRTYPKGTRIDSSNYNPQPGWNIGAQIVALNYQTKDFPMRLNTAKFVMNGGSGYLLKPRCLRVKGVPADSYGDRKQLTVTIICGVQLPKPPTSGKGEIIDPYVMLFVTGVEGDDTSTSPKTTVVVDNNGFNPTWKETFHFVLNSVEMALLTVRVMDKDTVGSDKFVGEGSIPVAALRCGYRAVPLVTERGEPIPSPSTVLCHFSLDHITSIRTDDI